VTTPLNKRVGQWWLNLLFWHARHAPAVPMALRPLFVWGTWIFSSAVRRGTLANAARLLDGHVPQRRRRRLARAVIGNFYDAVVEFGLNRRRSPEQLMALLESVQGEARYLETRRGERGPGRGRGAILVTAHIGSFEVAMAMLRSREPRVHVLFRRDELPLFEELRTAQHARLGVLEAPVEEGLATWAGLRDALAADEVVLMQGDRVMPGQPGVTVPFLAGTRGCPAGR
jgi:lauroyl/myristoyl acyltransferase